MVAHPLDDEAVFNIARKIESAELRAEYVQQVCGNDPQLLARVERLLRIHEQERDFLQAPAAGGAATVDVPDVHERPGMVIGHYKLLQRIGEGGFGVVFMAEQETPVRRTVAFKIIKPGMDSREVVARFEAERQALAMMNHPNIAHVFDGGVTESGGPYFVMELVKGVLITDYCDKNDLSTEERLRLFADVCHAVQHAHQKGVIHRDLKPSNIMVTLHDGQPVVKVIDFGVSKAINQRLTEKTLFTAYGQMVGTPQYMSPEQAEMSGLDVDTRSDVYSLGVLLYELLTGTTPLDAERLRDAGYAEIQRLIQEEEPVRPSLRISSAGTRLTVLAKHRSTEPKRLHQLVRGELDWIVMRALEKERSRRYESASRFAEDIERFLKGEAVDACPPSTGYRLRKFVRRNRLLVIGAAVVLVALLTGITGTSVGLLLAKREARRAEDARAETEIQRDVAEKGRTRLQLALADNRIKTEQLVDAKKITQRQNSALLLQRAFTAWGKGHFGRLDDSLNSLIPRKGEDDYRDFAWRFLWARRQESRPNNEITFDVPIFDLTYSPDGRTLAVALERGQVVLVDLSDPEHPTQHLLVAPKDDVLGWDAATSVAFSSSGRSLAAGGGSISGPGTVCVWEFPADGRSDLKDGKEQTGLILPVRRTLENPVVHPPSENLDTVRAYVTGVVLNPDGTLGASITGQGDLKVWTVATGQVLWSTQMAFFPLSRLSLSADGTVLVAWDDFASLGVWDLRTGKPVEAWKARLATSPVAISRDGQTLVNADYSVLHVWKVTADGPVPTRTIRGVPKRLAGMAVSPDGSHVATCGRYGVSIFDTRDGRTVGRFHHQTAVQNVAFSPDGHWLASGGQDGTLKVFDFRRCLSQSMEYDGGSSEEGFAVSGDGQTVALRTKATHSIVLWNTLTNNVLELPGSENRGGLFAFSPDGRRLVSTTEPDDPRGATTCDLWDSKTRTRTPLAERGDRVRAVHPDGDLIVVPKPQDYVGVSVLTRRDGSGQWTQQPLTAYPPDCTIKEAVAFSPDGRYLFCGGGSWYRYGFGILWNASGQTLEPIDEFHGTDRIYAAAFSPDSRLLAVVYRSNKLVFYDVASRRELSSQLRTTDALWGLSFSPDGRTLVAGTDGGIEFWRVSADTFELLGTFDVPTMRNAVVLNANALIVVHPGCLELLQVASVDEIPKPRD